MIKENAIPELITLFRNRGVSLYHACQLKDFKSYLRLGGIPSRALLELNHLPFTKFKSDPTDKQNGTWNNVFLNLSDFGNFFHNGTNSTPNTYGPILIKVDPECMENARDIALCLRSAGKKNFNRTQEALSSVKDADLIFEYPISEKTKASWIKKASELKSSFAHNPNIIVEGSPEMSCTIEGELIRIDYFTEIIVDPVHVGKTGLVSIVKDAVKQSHEDYSSIIQRSHVDNKYSELLEAVTVGVSTLKEIQSNNFSQTLKLWARNCETNGLDWQFGNFSEYLRLGTIEELEKIEYKITSASG